MVALVCTNVR